MKNQLFNKRMPTIFGIGFVVLGIVLTTVIVSIQTSLRSNAVSSQEPKNVKVTNLSDNAFSITYQTDTATTGSVNYGQSKELGNTQLEDMDKEKDNLSPKNVHSITVEKLSPDTKYYLVVISGQNTFLNNGAPFEITTAPDISSPSASQNILRGKVVLPDGNPPNEALVYLSTDNSQLLSTTVAKDGEFKFSLKGLRADDLSSYFEVKEDTVLKLFAISNSLESTVLFSGKETYLIPTITLSNDYDFTKDFVAIASKSAQSGFPSTQFKSENLKPQILTPKKEQIFTDQRPQFSGTSLPNETVEIIIRSDEKIQTQVKADSNGNWTYRPPTSLSPGAHTITIQARDSSGILTTIMQSFTVFAQEPQVSESTAPSATPTQTITPSLTPTPTLTLLPSPTITVFIPTPPPASGLSPTSMPIGSKGGLPPTGSSSVLLIMGGIATAISGIALFILTRTIL